MKPITMKTQLKDLVALAKENPGHQTEIALNEGNQAQVLIKIYVGVQTIAQIKLLDKVLVAQGILKENKTK
jgi:hypothetical protein